MSVLVVSILPASLYTIDFVPMPPISKADMDYLCYSIPLANKPSAPDWPWQTQDCAQRYQEGTLIRAVVLCVLWAPRAAGVHFKGAAAGPPVRWASGNLGNRKKLWLKMQFR